MNQVDYLSDKIVVAFVSFVAQMLTGEIAVDRIWSGFGARFGPVPDKTLEQLFRRYSWREKNFLETTRDLRPLRRALREALQKPAQLTGDTLWSCLKPFISWGMKDLKPYETWAQNQRERLVPMFMAGVAALNSDSPDLSALRAFKMYSGFVKPLSNAADHCIILDGRVGAALCLLVRQFLKVHPEFAVHGVPEVLAFRWGEQNPPLGQSPVPRNPSGDGFSFDQFSANIAHRAELNIRANWILQDARHQAGAKWCRGRYGHRHIEAALFMLGYQIDLPSERGAVVKPARLARRKMPLLTSFERAYAALLQQHGATVTLRTRRGIPFTAEAGRRRDGSPVIRFSHNNLLYPADWGYIYNSYGKTGQRIGQYVAQLDVWVASLTA